MQRRRFLQLAVSTSAAAAVSRASGLAVFSTPECRLHIAPSFPCATILSIHAKPVAMPPAIAAVPAAHLGLAVRSGALPEASHFIELLLEQLPDAHGHRLEWLVKGRSLPQAPPVPLARGVRHRLRMINATGQPHAIHLQDHCFQMVRVGQTPVSGVYTNTIRIERYSVVEADLVA